jgi:hypothetical protein
MIPTTPKSTTAQRVRSAKSPDSKWFLGVAGGRGKALVGGSCQLDFGRVESQWYLHDHFGPGIPGIRICRTGFRWGWFLPAGIVGPGGSRQSGFPRSPTEWFNTSIFSTAPQGVYGTERKGRLRGPLLRGSRYEFGRVILDYGKATSGVPI